MIPSSAGSTRSIRNGWETGGGPSPRICGPGSGGTVTVEPAVSCAIADRVSVANATPDRPKHAQMAARKMVLTLHPLIDFAVGSYLRLVLGIAMSFACSAAVSGHGC